MHIKRLGSCVCSHPPFPQQHLLFGPVFLVLALKFSHTPLKDGILRIAHLQFLAKGHTRESHHSLICADFATDQQMAEHTKECRNTLQRRGLLPHFCCIDVLAAFAGCEPKSSQPWLALVVRLNRRLCVEPSRRLKFTFRELLQRCQMFLRLIVFF